MGEKGKKKKKKRGIRERTICNMHSTTIQSIVPWLPTDKD
jgi:hypothetical protein